MDIKPLAKTPLINNTDKATWNWFVELGNRINQLIAHTNGAVATTWDSLTGKPETFTPSAHKTTHAAGGIDALTPADIGAATYITGEVRCFAFGKAPEGWLKCNGDLVSRTTYSALFAAIGTTFGAGDGLTTFKLPDLRGEFIRGWDDGRGIDGNRGFGSWQAQDVQPHTHGMNGALDWYYSGSWMVNGGIYGAQNKPTGTNSGSETRPRNIALLYCIKY